MFTRMENISEKGQRTLRSIVASMRGLEHRGISLFGKLWGQNQFSDYPYSVPGFASAKESGI